MKICSKVTVLESDLKESSVMSNLMVEFPPISKEDPPEVLAAYVYQSYQDTGEATLHSTIMMCNFTKEISMGYKNKSPA
jgi:hypothetical protein